MEILMWFCTRQSLGNSIITNWSKSML